MMNSFKEKGIVLKTVKWREADLIVTILLSKGSAKSFIATNALKSKKRFGGGVLEPSHYIQFSYSEKGDMAYLQEASILNDFVHIRSRLDQLNYSMEGLQFLLKSTKENLEDESIFHLMGNFLNHMTIEVNPKKLYLHFQVRLLMILGILPNEPIYQLFTSNDLSQNVNLHISDELVRKMEYQLKTVMSEYYTV